MNVMIWKLQTWNLASVLVGIRVSILQSQMTTNTFACKAVTGMPLHTRTTTLRIARTLVI